MALQRKEIYKQNLFCLEGNSRNLGSSSVFVGSGEGSGKPGSFLACRTLIGIDFSQADCPRERIDPMESSKELGAVVGLAVNWALCHGTHGRD